MTYFHHTCNDRDCIYLGQRTSANMCKCHKTTDQMMADHIDRLTDAARKALNYIENTESELGIQLGCGDALRSALPSDHRG